MNSRIIQNILPLLILAVALSCTNSGPSKADKKLAEITRQLQEQEKQNAIKARADSIKMEEEKRRIAKEDSIKRVEEKRIADARAKEQKCKCGSRTFRSRSHHTWVEFRLPKNSKDGRVIKIQKGAHNKYVFPKCNRVRWTNLTFKCYCGTWKKVSGDWDADAFCHGTTKRNSPYVFVGEH